ncbi:AAA family ATPase [Clostridium sp. CTA-5]
MIRLKKLEIKNFKGIKELTVTFGTLTSILGENGTGKSTIFDGFSWLLFGKDSHDKKDFEVQTLDEYNNVIHGLEHYVIGYLEVDGVEKTFKRRLKERWVKPNGKAEKELKGCTTEFEIDDIPVKQKEYQTAINELIDENLFKMVTNPLYFSSLNWTKQREILLDIIGDISEENVINYNKDLEPLKALLTDGIDNFNKRIKASISKLKEQVKSIPYRIDECNNSIVEVDFSELELKKAHIQSKINVIDEQIADESKVNDTKLRLQDELYKLKEERSKKQQEVLKSANKPLDDIQNNINQVRNRVQDLAYKIQDSERDKERKNKYIEAVKKDLEEQKLEKQALLDKYHIEYDKEFEFDTSLICCPTCGREYETDKLGEIKTNAESRFNIEKSKLISKIITDGKIIAADIEKLTIKIESCDKEIQEIAALIKGMNLEKTSLDEQLELLEKEKEPLTITKEIHFKGEEELNSKIDKLKNQIEEFKEVDNSELKAKKRALQEEVEDITKILGKKDTNSELKKRMEELNQEEKDLQIKIAELEGQQYLGEEFIRTKVELLEDSINKKFKGAVTFKLFNQQVNGGLSETCEALINGVPFSNANTASRINAGLSIINTLCQHYKVSAPVFIDNAEAINEIGNTDSQLIKLVVSLDKNIKVEVNN